MLNHETPPGELTVAIVDFSEQSFNLLSLERVGRKGSGYNTDVMISVFYVEYLLTYLRRIGSSTCNAKAQSKANCYVQAQPKKLV